jgi:hypothetical protein
MFVTERLFVLAGTSLPFCCHRNFIFIVFDDEDNENEPPVATKRKVCAGQYHEYKETLADSSKKVF